MIILRQSTASQEVPLGPFLDATDGDTAMTGLTIANTDIKLWVTGATSLANKNSGGATHISGGIYYCVLDATDTATVGPLVIHCHPSTALACKQECLVLEEAVFDAFYTSSSPGYVSNAPVNVAQFGGSNGTFSSGRPEVNVSHAAGTAWNSGAIGPNTLASDTITAAKVASDVTTELQNGLATASALSSVASNVTDILADTGTDGVVVATASKTGYRLSSTGVDDILRTALTEAYAADGAAGTLSQILFGIQALLQERSVSGTTVTVKKLDGSTTAMTFTINDGTNPTSITRAT